MARPITHGARFLAIRLERNRTTPRTRRLLRQIQVALLSNTWPTLTGLVHGRIARRELMMQQREQHLLADATAEGGKWLLGMWAAQRRDIEMLALLLDRDAAPKVPDLQTYLASRADAPPAPTPLAHDATVATEPGDAADAPARSTEPAA
jgi:hypothetical protein